MAEAVELGRPLSLDDRLRDLLNSWRYWESATELLNLGPAAMDRVLDAAARKISFWNGKGDGRDYEDGLRAAVAAFAQQDLDGVLAAMTDRGWRDIDIAMSGVARVSDSRVVPYLLKAVTHELSTIRVAAVNSLALQHGKRVEQALVAALADESPNVRRAAITVLGEVGDASVIEQLGAIKARFAASKIEPELVKEAVGKIRRRGNRGGRRGR